MGGTYRISPERLASAVERLQRILKAHEVLYSDQGKAEIIIEDGFHEAGILDDLPLRWFPGLREVLLEKLSDASLKVEQEIKEMVKDVPSKD